MSEFAITLSSSQDDALQLLTQRARIDLEDENLTADTVLQTFVSQALGATEVEIETKMQLLMAAGVQLPSVIRARMTETLTPAQMVLLAHLQEPPAPAP